MRISTALRSVVCDAAVDQIEVGSGTAVLQAWSGSVPTAVTDAPAGTKLVEFSLPDPAFGAAASGVATANAITATVGITDGTIGFVRVVNQNGDALWDDNSVGVGSGAVQFNTLTVVTGAAITVTSWTVTVPAS